MARKESKKKQSFNEFRFAGLNYRQQTNKYLTMERVSEDETKVVVKVSDNHIFTTKYGYGLILNMNHVIFLKDWQVSYNYYGTEVLLDKKYFTPKEWGCFEDFGTERENETFEEWLEVAKQQNATIVEEDGFERRINPVKWEF